MGEMQIFENPEFGSIRTVTMDGEPWFVGKDVAIALGHTNPSKALNDHVSAEDKLNNETLSSLGQRGGWLINESGLYSLIFSSKIESAKHFKHWVTSEVLPTIRKTGGYVSNDDQFIATYLPYADEPTQSLFRATLETIRSQTKIIKDQEQHIKEDRPKVIFADSVNASNTTILIGELAKIIKQNGVEICQNRLFKWLRENGYLINRKGTDCNMPTQKSMNLGLFRIKERSINNPDGSVRITKTVLVTGKGQQYFINKFLALALHTYT